MSMMILYFIITVSLFCYYGIHYTSLNLLGMIFWPGTQHLALIKYRMRLLHLQRSTSSDGDLNLLIKQDGSQAAGRQPSSLFQNAEKTEALSHPGPDCSINCHGNRHPQVWTTSSWKRMTRLGAKEARVCRMKKQPSRRGAVMRKLTSTNYDNLFIDRELVNLFT